MVDFPENSNEISKSPGFEEPLEPSDSIAGASEETQGDSAELRDSLDDRSDFHPGDSISKVLEQLSEETAEAAQLSASSKKRKSKKNPLNPQTGQLSFSATLDGNLETAESSPSPMTAEVSDEMDDPAQLSLSSQVLSEISAEERSETLDDADREAQDGAELGAENNVQTEIQMDIDEIQSCMESILFISDKPLSLQKLRDLLGPQFDKEIFEQAIQALQQRYQSIHHGIELLEIAGGYQFRTKAGRAHLAQKLVKTQSQRLSTGGMETLAIVAYKQPVMKEEVDKIRGVDSSYFIRGLLDKKLIEISGRSELPGRPLVYSTTQMFLEVFGLRDLAALPSLRELEQMVPASEVSADGETPQTREMRKVINAMNQDRTSELYYNPREDEKILKEIRERVTSIATSTPYLDDLKAAELQAKLEAEGKLPPASEEPARPPVLEPISAE